MKQVLLLVGLFMSISLFSCDDDDKKVEYADLPANAQAFLFTHFADVDVVSIQKDNDGYDVRLKNGFSVNFDLDGEWDDVDGSQMPVPTSITALLPSTILAYIVQNYNDYKIVEVNKEHYGYEITLLDKRELELKFDQRGNFLETDN